MLVSFDCRDIGVCCIFRCESIVLGASVVGICRMSDDALLTHSARQNPTFFLVHLIVLLVGFLRQIVRM